MPRSNQSPQNRALSTERAIERRVTALERRTPVVPVLDDDPPEDSRCNLWIVGTQLRYRDASGTIHTFT